jgi:hypothetical protein
LITTPLLCVWSDSITGAPAASSPNLALAQPVDQLVQSGLYLRPGVVTLAALKQVQVLWGRKTPPVHRVVITARIAEDLRRQAPHRLVLSVGSELTLFMQGLRRIDPTRYAGWISRSLDHDCWHLLLD